MNDNPWEAIYRRDGHVFTDLPPVAAPFAELLDEHACQEILDLGCGNGRFLVHFARRGLRVTGLDSAPTALKLARDWLARESLKGDLLQADTRVRLPFEADAFDALLSTQVIHHARLELVLGTVAEISRVVKPGGLVLVSVPVYQPREQADEEFAESDEIEYHTFVPCSGSEAGLPHHLFTLEEFGAAFPAFDILSLKVYGEKVLALTGRKRAL
jgi:SAM-dependent methyltransferase